MLRHTLIRLTHPFLRRWYTRWNTKERRYTYEGLDLVVLPGSFHPGIFGSTRAMAQWVAQLPLKGRNFLELGAGTGMVALIAARGGARVTASDVNPMAVENVRRNAEGNGLSIRAVTSDLFASIPEHFDVIAINPPYYRRDPASVAERAFFAGADLEYFRRLLPELAVRTGQGTEVYMVLSVDLDKGHLNALLTGAGLWLKPVHRFNWLGETQMVHRVMGQ